MNGRSFVLEVVKMVLMIAFFSLAVCGLLHLFLCGMEVEMAERQERTREAVEMIVAQGGAPVDKLLKSP